MSNQFTRLEELSTQLNASSDALSEAIKRVEAKLASLRLGVIVWHNFPIEVEGYVDHDGESGGDIVTKFGYTKIDGKWCLALSVQRFKEGRRFPEDSAKLTPLLQAPRNYRIQGLELIPELIKEIEAAAEAEIQTVQSAIAIGDTV